jgi:hypothetical protein
MSDYGTMWEARKMLTINDYFGQPVINPAQTQFQKGWKREGMSFFDRFFLPRIDTLIFASFPDYSVGSGVGYEVHAALKADVKVYQMSRDINLMTEIFYDFDYLSREETRERIRKFSETF